MKLALLMTVGAYLALGLLVLLVAGIARCWAIDNRVRYMPFTAREWLIAWLFWPFGLRGLVRR